LETVGSKWVAGWVAGCYLQIPLIYALYIASGSRCSSFIQILALEEKRKRKEREYTYRYLSRDKLLHLLPRALVVALEELVGGDRGAA
jgi:hypothetical protein